MQKTLLEQLAAEIDPVEAAYFDLADIVAERVGKLLQKNTWSQRTLAHRLGKPESYVSRLLAGGQNVTLRTLAELHNAFGEPIITTLPQVQRDLEDGVVTIDELVGFSELKEVVDILSRGTDRAPQPTYARGQASSGGAPATIHSFTETALGVLHPERFLYSVGSHC